MISGGRLPYTPVTSTTFPSVSRRGWRLGRQAGPGPRPGLPPRAVPSAYALAGPPSWPRQRRVFSPG